MQDFYGQCGDEELILRLRDGEENITDYIMDKYKNLVKSKARSMYILGADSDLPPPLVSDELVSFLSLQVN